MQRWLVVLLLFAASPAVAQDMLTSLSPNELKAQLERWGYKVFAHEDENDRPQLLVSKTGQEGGGPDERKGFAMRMLGCVPEDTVFYDRRCDGYEFRAYLTPGFPIKDKVYAEWNREFGGARAFVKENHPRLAWRVSVRGGVSWMHVHSTVDIWREELMSYLDLLDASVMD